MTKDLSYSYAILALEEKGYEQANNKPSSFAKTLGALSIVCRLGKLDALVNGAFFATITVEDQTYQTRLTVPVLIASDIEKAEQELLSSLNSTIEEARELLKVDYLRSEDIARRAKAWLGVALEEI